MFKSIAICFIISLLMHIGAISTDRADAQSFGAGVFRAVRFNYQVQDCCHRRGVFVLMNIVQLSLKRFYRCVLIVCNSLPPQKPLGIPTGIFPRKEQARHSPRGTGR